MARVVILTGSPHYEGSSQKLADNNEVWDEEKKNSYERKYPFIFFKTALYDWKEIYNKVIRKHKK